jgi:tripartite-type tricarboxylate transporter receptor subunit TctC
MFSRRIVLHTVMAVTVVSAAVVGTSFAQPAPASGKLVRVMNGFPPGGSADIVTRILAERLRANYAPNIIVENRPGGGGRTVLDHARNGDSDGTSIVLTPTAMLTIFPHVYTKLGYDTFRDFTAVGSAATFVTAITAGPGMPTSVKSLTDLIEWSKTLPQGANYGSPGAGTSLHFVGTMLGRRAGGKMTHVPYKGAAPMMQDLLGGAIPVGMAPIGDAVTHSRGGKVRVLATTGTKRSKFMPDVPTATESGFSEIVAEDFFALFVPSKTPPETVERLGTAIREALASQEVADRFAQLGLEVRPTTPKEMGDIVRAQHSAWAPIVKASGFSIDD